MTNSEITSKLKLAAKLMELHGDNPFKIRSYQTIEDTIYSLPGELADMTSDEISAVEGIGKGMSANICSLLDRGSFDGLDQLLEVTPEGVIEMLKIPGFGPKKISTLWKDAGAETLEDLLGLCHSGQIAEFKGFGQKSQDSLLQAVNFLIGCRNKLRYAQAEKHANELIEVLRQNQLVEAVSETGDLRRRMEIIDEIDILVATHDFEGCRKTISGIDGLTESISTSGPFTWRGIKDGCVVPVKIRFTPVGNFQQTLLATTGSINHINSVLADGSALKDKLVDAFSDETEFYKRHGMAFIAPELREGLGEVDKALKGDLPQLVEMSDLKGILHNHSTYSDGKHSLRQMAEACRDLGYQYLGISDHSQTAVYAGGLQEFEVKKQQEEIAQLNAELAPFKIFSGIESDILNDGALDYNEEILSSFDFIVASVHSGLNMDINKATNRLLNAIRNPYTTILGHMTGRLILEREGYPVDHKEIINACAEQGVVIEINASPYRLDMDWRWVEYALEKGVMLSINPDAHKMDGYKDMYYGLLAGRKGGLTKDMTLNAMSLDQISSYFSDRKNKISK